IADPGAEARRERLAVEVAVADLEHAAKRQPIGNLVGRLEILLAVIAAAVDGAARVFVLDVSDIETEIAPGEADAGRDVELRIGKSGPQARSPDAGIKFEPVGRRVIQFGIALH